MTDQPNLWNMAGAAPASDGGAVPAPDLVPLDVYGSVDDHTEAPAGYVPADYEPSSVDTAPERASAGAARGTSRHPVPRCTPCPPARSWTLIPLNPAQREAVSPPKARCSSLRAPAQARRAC